MCSWNFKTVAKQEKFEATMADMFPKMIKKIIKQQMENAQQTSSKRNLNKQHQAKIESIFSKH